MGVEFARSLIATCRLQGIDPRAYLEDVLQRVSVLGTGVECRASDLPGAR